MKKFKKTIIKIFLPLGLSSTLFNISANAMKINKKTANYTTNYKDKIEVKKNKNQGLSYNVLTNEILNKIYKENICLPKNESIINKENIDNFYNDIREFIASSIYRYYDFDFPAKEKIRDIFKNSKDILDAFEKLTMKAKFGIRKKVLETIVKLTLKKNNNKKKDIYDNLLFLIVRIMSSCEDNICTYIKSLTDGNLNNEEIEDNIEELISWMVEKEKAADCFKIKIPNEINEEIEHFIEELKKRKESQDEETIKYIDNGIENIECFKDFLGKAVDIANNVENDENLAFDYYKK